MQSINVGIIGLGVVAKNQIKALRLTGLPFEIKAFCDINPQKKLDNCDIPFFTDCIEMVKNVKLDMVLISVPYEQHYEVARSMLLSNVNIALEKPATESVEQFTILQDIAQKNHLLLYSMYHTKYGPEILWYKSNKDKILKKYGNISYFEAYFYDPYLIDSVLVPASIPLKGSWVDSGINALSVLSSLFDQYKVFELEKINIDNSDSNISAKANIMVTNGNHTSKGKIFTDWTLCTNHKSIKLFLNDNICLILNSREMSAVLVDGDIKTNLFVHDTKNSSLQEHYINVFLDLYYSFIQNTDNRTLSLKLLQNLYVS